MLNMGEIVTVTKHDPEGRILEFVKTPIPLGDAKELVAAALVENERKKDVALLRDAKALLASAKAINRKLAATPVDDKPSTPNPPAPPIKSVRQAALPAPPVPPQKRSINSKVDLLDPRFASLMQAWAERDGSQMGKSFMAKSLEPHAGCAAGSRAEITGQQLDEVIRTVLEQLSRQNFLPIKKPGLRDAFIKAFRAGVDGAIADFNERSAVRAEMAG
jgi:hypothetical protein